MELRVGPHDNRRKSGEKHYNYFNAYFFVNLSAPYCGNGIRETGESCDGAAGVNALAGEVCSSSCTIIPPTIPVVKWESHKTAEELRQGRNLTAGDTFVLEYSANNSAGISYDLKFDSILYKVPFSNQNSDYYYDHNNLYYKYMDFFETSSVISRGGLSEESKIITVPAGQVVYFNRTIIVPNLDDENQNVIERFLYYERFKYKKTSDSSFRYPKLANGN